MNCLTFNQSTLQSVYATYNFITSGSEGIYKTGGPPTFLSTAGQSEGRSTVLACRASCHVQGWAPLNHRLRSPEHWPKPLPGRPVNPTQAAWAWAGLWGRGWGFRGRGRGFRGRGRSFRGRDVCRQGPRETAGSGAQRPSAGEPAPFPAARRIQSWGDGAGSSPGCAGRDTICCEGRNRERGWGHQAAETRGRQSRGTWTPKLCPHGLSRRQVRSGELILCPSVRLGCGGADHTGLVGTEGERQHEHPPGRLRAWEEMGTVAAGTNKRTGSGAKGRNGCRGWGLDRGARGSVLVPRAQDLRLSQWLGVRRPGSETWLRDLDQSFYV